MDFLGSVLGFLGGFGDWVKSSFLSVLKFLARVKSAFRTVLGFFGRAIKSIAGAISRVAHAVAHVKTSGLWVALARWYKTYRKWTEWFSRRILQPIEQLRRNILHIYEAIFAPIIRTMDAFRRMVGLIAIFDRKLARKLDNRLLELEGIVLKPITVMFQRLSALTNITRALITLTGRIDGTVFVSTIIRHANVIRAVLFGAPLGKRIGSVRDSLADAIAARDRFVSWTPGDGSELDQTVEEGVDGFKRTMTALGG